MNLPNLEDLKERAKGLLGRRDGLDKVIRAREAADAELAQATIELARAEASARLAELLPQVSPAAVFAACEPEIAALVKLETTAAELIAAMTQKITEPQELHGEARALARDLGEQLPDLPTLANLRHAIMRRIGDEQQAQKRGENLSYWFEPRIE